MLIYLFVIGIFFFWIKLFKNSNLMCILLNFIEFYFLFIFVNVLVIDVNDNCLDNLEVFDLDYCLFEDGLYNDSF